MNFRCVVLTATLVTWLASPGVGQRAANGGWELVSAEKDLSVYTRTTDGTPIKEIQIVTTIEGSIEKVTDLLSDVPNYTSWVYKCTVAQRIKTTSTNDFHYYVETALPYPFSNRDLLVHSTQWWDKNGGYHSHSAAEAALVPEKKGLVRITEFESNWVITPRGDGFVDIVYTAMANPGGEIPIWLVNLVITKGPLETMQRFAELARIPASSED